MSIALAFLAGILRFFLDTKTGRVVLAVSAAVLALWLWTAYATHRGYVAAIEQELAKTAAESYRREQVIEANAAEAEEAAGRIAKLEEANRVLLKDINSRSRLRDAFPCLDSNAVKRLQTLRR